MSQLALFEGAHIPRTAAREALSRGELGEARGQLARLGGATPEAADAARLERIAAALPARGDAPAETLHAAFASALAEPEPRGFLSHAEWFHLYAQRVARSLEASPARRFRGWLGAHFAFAIGDSEAARRAARQIAESQPAGPAWIEAARLAFELGLASDARGWLYVACLESPVDLVPDPPALEPCGLPALDAAPALPPLPAPVETLFDFVRELDELPGRRSRWVAAVGEIDRVLAPLEPGDASGADTAAPGAPMPEAPTPEGDAVREFLAALRSARRSRERDGPRSPDRCSDRELRARRRMQRLAPALFARYLRALGGSFF